MQFIKSLFQAHRPNTLASVKLQDINRQLKDLEVRERQVERELDGVQREGAKLLSDYREARTQGNDLNADFLARKYEGIKPRTTNLEQRHADLLTQRRISEGLKLVKENEQWLREIAGNGIFKVDISDLQVMLEDTISEQGLTRDRMEQLAVSVASGQTHAEPSEARKARLSELDKIAFGDGQQNEAIDEGLRAIDEALAQSERPVQDKPNTVSPALRQADAAQA